MRVLAATVALLALCAGCSNTNNKKEPRVETKDGPSAETKDRPSVGPLSDEQVRKLFDAAAACTPPCQPLDDLRELARTSAAQVAAVALEIMADPLSRTDQGVGQMSMTFVDDWLRTGPDQEARQRTAQALERVVARGSTFMRTTAYALLAEFHLPDAQRILIAEVENPARGGGERGAAGTALGIALEGDFSLIRRWLSDDQPYHWEAALEMMKAFDDFNAGNEPLWTEVRALLIALGKRPELPGAVVYGLAFYFEIYLDIDRGDSEIRALAERLAKHPDDAAAGQMRKILVQND